MSLQFANGSAGTIHYLANGDRAYSKERVEVFGGGAVATLEDFRGLELVRYGRKQTIRSRWRQDKGHRGEWEALAASIRSGNQAPISFEDIVSTTLTTLKIASAQSTGQTTRVDTSAFISEALGFRPAEG